MSGPSRWSLAEIASSSFLVAVPGCLLAMRLGVGPYVGEGYSSELASIFQLSHPNFVTALGAGLAVGLVAMTTATVTVRRSSSFRATEAMVMAAAVALIGAMSFWFLVAASASC